MKPFFTYFGGKYRTAKYYPFPEHGVIIEPFAGSAGYSLRHYNRKVLLYDLHPAVYGVWDYLIKSSPEDIRRLPLQVAHVSELKVCQEAKWLIGFWMIHGRMRPAKQPSYWMMSGEYPNNYWGESIRSRLAVQVRKIKHWKVFNKSYEQAGNENATWFIDPPYVKAGKNYKFCLCESDYAVLSEWCRKRQGQVIVCEAEGAEWLPFKAFKTTRSMNGNGREGKSKEVIWTNSGNFRMPGFFDLHNKEKS